MAHGLYLLHKKKDEESHEALRNLKKALALPPTRKDIGHTGTLDPFASGLLLVGIGEGTKLIGALSDLPKTYIGQVVLGATTLPLDWTEARSYQIPSPRLSEEQLLRFFGDQVGTFDQVPPAHSAIHVQGKRSYEWARAGNPQEMPTRKIKVHSCRFLSSQIVQDGEQCLQVANVEVQVSSGTYIRALARDWGQVLTGFSGSLRELFRSSVGPWSLEDLPPGSFRKLTTQELGMFFDLVKLSQDSVQVLKTNGVFPELDTLKASKNGWCFIDERGEIHGVWVEDPPKRFRRVIRVENPKKIE